MSVYLFCIKLFSIHGFVHQTMRGHAHAAAAAQNNAFSNQLVEKKSDQQKTRTNYHTQLKGTKNEMKVFALRRWIFSEQRHGVLLSD